MNFIIKKQKIIGLVFFLVTVMVANVVNIENAKSASDTVSRDYNLGFSSRTNDPVDRYYGGGRVNVNHYVNSSVVNNGSVCANQSINFSYDANITFSKTGGWWDTPYGGMCDNLNTWCGIGAPPTGTTGNNYWARFNDNYTAYLWNRVYLSNNYGFVSWTGIKPTVWSGVGSAAGKVRVTSSDGSIVSCSGIDCTAKGKSGTVTLTARIPQTPVRVWAKVGDLGYNVTPYKSGCTCSPGPNATIGDCGKCKIDYFNPTTSLTPNLTWKADNWPNPVRLGDLSSDDTCFSIHDWPNGARSDCANTIDLPATNTMKWTVNVTECNPPVAEIVTPTSGQTFSAGDTISFTGTGSDPDGDPINWYRWRTACDGGGDWLASGVNTTSFTRTYNTPGTYTVYLQVRSNNGSTNSWSSCDSVTFNVDPPCATNYQCMDIPPTVGCSPSDCPSGCPGQVCAGNKEINDKQFCEDQSICGEGIDITGDKCLPNNGNTPCNLDGVETGVCECVDVSQNITNWIEVPANQ